MRLREQARRRRRGADELDDPVVPAWSARVLVVFLAGLAAGVTAVWAVLLATT